MNEDARSIRDIVTSAVEGCYDRFIAQRPPADVVADDVMLALTAPQPSTVSEETEVAIFVLTKYREKAAEVERLRDGIEWLCTQPPDVVGYELPRLIADRESARD